MPKGVEHAASALTIRSSIRVPLPVMPKGVEHIRLSSASRTGSATVPLPVMPKGVEHTKREARAYAKAACPSQ